MITCENIGDIWLDGTSRQGKIKTTVFALTEMFGLPKVVCETQREWALRFLHDDGSVTYATIAPTPFLPGSFDIGGFKRDAVFVVTQFLEGYGVEAAVA